MDTPLAVRRDFPVAPLPAPAWALGSFALLVGLAAMKSLVKDLAEGRPPWIAAGFVNTVLLALLWVMVDQPTVLRLDGRTLHIVTRVRTVRVEVSEALRAEPLWHGGLFGPKFAINGGYGWYGWFWKSRQRQRAFVTDSSRAVRVYDPGGRIYVVSPREPEAFLAALA